MMGDGVGVIGERDMYVCMHVCIGGYTRRVHSWHREKVVRGLTQWGAKQKQRQSASIN